MKQKEETKKTRDNAAVPGAAVNKEAENEKSMTEQLMEAYDKDQKYADRAYILALIAIAIALQALILSLFRVL